MPNPLFGSKPTVPKWRGLDLGTESARAIQTNIENAPEASRLANLTEDQLLNMLRSVVPGFDAQRDQISKNIQAELKGEIPEDVNQAIQNNAASKALRGGYAGSGMHGDLVARDLGLTSLSLMDKGLSSAESWLASTERMLSPAMNVFESMFITPQQQAAFDVSERDKKFEHDWLAQQIGAMPNPSTAGWWTIGTAFGTAGLSAMMSGGKSYAQAGGQSGQIPQMSFGGGGGGGGGGTGDMQLDGWDLANPAQYNQDEGSYMDMQNLMKGGASLMEGDFGAGYAGLLGIA